MTFLSSTIPKEDLEERIDRSISWLVDNEMIVRVGEDESVAEMISSSRENKNEIDPWEDNVPNWAMAARGIVDLEKISNSFDHRRKLSPRKGPAVFWFQSR